MDNWFGILCIPKANVVRAFNIGPTRRYVVLAEDEASAVKRIETETNWKPHTGCSIVPANPDDPHFDTVLGPDYDPRY